MRKIFQIIDIGTYIFSSRYTSSYIIYSEQLTNTFKAYKYKTIFFQLYLFDRVVDIFNLLNNILTLLISALMFELLRL